MSFLFNNMNVRMKIGGFRLGVPVMEISVMRVTGLEKEDQPQGYGTWPFGSGYALFSQLGDPI